MPATEFVPIDWNPVAAVVADLDGTLYLGESALPGALNFVREAQQRKPLFFLSNNTSKTPDCTWEKLVRLGFPVQLSQVLSPLHSLVQAVRANGLRNLWIQANPDVQAWLQKQLPECECRAPRNKTECVVLTYDDTLSYQDLCEIGWRLQDGTSYWITHPDFVCPNPAGPVPDVGSLVELFASAYKRRPECVFGKPNPEILSPVFAQHSASQVLFIGDRLYTDWELAKRAGCQFRLTLRGETTLEQWEALSDGRPLVLDFLD
ncbi:MAG TPA: HAD hydrolase-like protein [Fibrobacteraceae bacterium]|nr:HAD hydrolase-like protein [Fibrobacteraceae bacterium]